jgi:cytochrome b6-f complex iron-sulfur subunit
MERKEFLKNLALGGAVLGTLPLLQCCSAGASSAPTVDYKIDISTAPYTSLQTAGGSYADAAKGLIIARDNAGNFKAVSIACTHEGVSVGYNAGSDTFVCPRHGARFNNTGTVTQGPASSDLKKYTTVLTGTSLHIYG